MKNCDILLSLLEKNNVLTAKHTEIMRVPFPSEKYTGFQGGCSDGERYYYQVLMHYEMSDRSKDYCCIAKIDLESKTVVKYSEAMSLDHANDIAYHKGKGQLILVNNKPHPNRITFIDPETLTVTEQKEIEIPIYALEYNESRGLYLAGVSGAKEFCFLDSDFKVFDGRTYRTTVETDRCVKQGASADDNLLYFILFDGKFKNSPDFQNRIAIYDWNGNSRGCLNFDLGYCEPENLSIVGGDIIAVCGLDNPILYKLTPEE